MTVFIRYSQKAGLHALVLVVLSTKAKKIGMIDTTRQWAIFPISFELLREISLFIYNKVKQVNIIKRRLPL